VEAVRPQIMQQSSNMYPTAPGMPSAPMATMSRAGGQSLSSAYPSLRDFMGLELTEEMIRLNMPEYFERPALGYPTLSGNAVAVPQANGSELILINAKSLLDLCSSIFIK